LGFKAITKTQQIREERMELVPATEGAAKWEWFRAFTPDIRINKISNSKMKDQI